MAGLDEALPKAKTRSCGKNLKFVRFFGEKSEMQTFLDTYHQLDDALGIKIQRSKREMERKKRVGLSIFRVPPAKTRSS